MATKTISAICDQVALEIGLTGTSDPFSDPDVVYAQMVALANSCGTELLEEGEWEVLRRENTFTTTALDTGIYDLPSDFAYMIDQTGWERAENVPLGGPLSPQTWAWLQGRDLVSYTIYASFRITQGKLYLFPQPPTAGLNIAYEYISDNWVQSAAGDYQNTVQAASDVVQFNAHLFERLLKLRVLEARGFDTTKAQDQYLASLESWGGKEKSAPILSVSRGVIGVPYVDVYRNTGDTGYGT